jgi:uncharacterized integral membrane protein
VKGSWIRAANFVVLVAGATAFAALNGGQRVRIDLGLMTLERVSVPILVFASVVVGMAICILAGARADLRNRRRMRRYRELREED